MQLKKIEYFIRIVELGSLTKAAESLYLTQPTMSRFLEKLEEEAGVRLFTRSRNNSLRLTECGKKYYESALEINRIWEKLSADIAASTGASRRRESISVGVSDDHSQIYVSSCMEELTRLFPGISVSLFFHSAEELPSMVANGDLDIAVSAYLDECESLVYLHVQRAEVDLAVPLGHPLARYSYNIPGQEKARIPLSMVDKASPFVLIHEPTVLRQEEMRYFKRMRFEPNIQRTYVRHGTVADIISGSDSLIGFCPRSLKSDKIACVALDPPFYYKNAVFYRKDRLLTPPERRLTELLAKRPDTRSI